VRNTSSSDSTNVVRWKASSRRVDVTFRLCVRRGWRSVSAAACAACWAAACTGLCACVRIRTRAYLHMHVEDAHKNGEGKHVDQLPPDAERHAQPARMQRSERTQQVNTWHSKVSSNGNGRLRCVADLPAEAMQPGQASGWAHKCTGSGRCRHAGLWCRRHSACVNATSE
jgi:hypothetical protein